MRSNMIGVLMAALIIFSLPNLALAIAVAEGYEWSTQDAFTAKVQIKYVDGNGSQVVVNRTLVNDTTGSIIFLGPDNSGNAYLEYAMIAPDGYVRCGTLGSLLTVGNKGQFTGSWDVGVETYTSTYLYVDGGSYLMAAADVNASYSEAMATLSPDTGAMNIKIKITIVGLLQTPGGTFPARVTITTAAKSMPNLGSSGYVNFNRPFTWTSGI